MLVYLVPAVAVTPAKRPSGLARRLYGRADHRVLRIEVESPVGARGECLLQTAAGCENQDGGGPVGGFRGAVRRVEPSGDAAARAERVRGGLPRTSGARPL